MYQLILTGLLAAAPVPDAALGAEPAAQIVLVTSDGSDDRGLPICPGDPRCQGPNPNPNPNPIPQPPHPCLVASLSFAVPDSQRVSWADIADRGTISVYWTTDGGDNRGLPICPGDPRCQGPCAAPNGSAKSRELRRHLEAVLDERRLSSWG